MTNHRNKIVLKDGHAHLGSQMEQEIRLQNNIESFVCASYPEECEKLECAAKTNSCLVPIYGLHPWYSDKYPLEAMMPYFKKAALIGEIGMDSVWCQVPVNIQREQFKKQLEIAQTLGCPVVLHTKGEEKEILNAIKLITIPKLVHWYSCENYLKGYLENDCYFTIGPDVRKNPVVQEIIKQSDLSRLLVETDGFDSVLWAVNEKLNLTSLPDILLDSMKCIGEIKQKSIEEVADQLEQNFKYIKNYKKLY